MAGRLAEFWWGRVPTAAARLSSALAIMFRDGVYLEASPPVAALAPIAALVVGFIAGWRHPLTTDVYMTSLLVLIVALVVGTLSAALGAWLVIGFSLGDLLLGARSTVFLGAFTNSGKTWAALILCDLVLAMLVVLIPLSARALANEASGRWFVGRGLLPEVIVGVVVEALLVFAWAQAALVLTRPFFLWHGLPPSSLALDTLHKAAWALPLVALGAASLRAWLEIRLTPVAPERPPLPRHAHRVLPPAVVVVLRVALAVFLLAGLMDSFVDPIVIAVVMAAFLVLREPALRRMESQTAFVMRVPVLPQLILGAIVSAIVAIIVVAAFGTTSVVRPVVISTLISLIVFTVLLPDHVLGEHELHEEAHEAPAGVAPQAASPP